MILVDTSVWIDYFNGVGNPETDRLDAALAEGSVAIGGMTFCPAWKKFIRCLAGGELNGCLVWPI
ncbi:MAG: hypothetical protein R6U87_07175 [Thiohalospira sp.]